MKTTRTARGDITGQRFGRLVALYRGHLSANGRNYKWAVRCDCGVEKLVNLSGLTGGSTNSCGCLRREVARKNGAAHVGYISESMKSAYRSWCSMRQRCLNKHSTDYKNYGGRGISICLRWIDSFECFFIDMGIRPDGKTLDRMDVNGDYEKNNCKWSTRSEQAKNRRSHGFQVNPWVYGRKKKA